MTTPAPRPQPRPRPSQRLLGLAATILIALLVAGIPALLVTIGATPWATDLPELRTLLSSPDDGTLATTVIAAVAWVAWLVVAVSVALEVIAHVRGLPTPSVPGLAGPQRAAGQLVTMAALLFVATPVLVAAFPAPPAHTVAAAPVLDRPRSSAADSAPALTATAPLLATPSPALPNATPVRPTKSPVLPTSTPVPREARSSTARNTIEYTVRRGDSLWRIAERLLGDGARFTEIVDLNRSVLHGQPDFITAGTVLRVPDETTDADQDRGIGTAAGEYVVQAGDTLWEIAEEELGDPLAYPELFEASRKNPQPNGAHLTDPNLIQPGWKITIPERARPEPAPAPVTTPPQKPPDKGTPLATAEPEVDPPTAEQSPTAAPGDTTTDAPDHETSASPGWLLPGLTGGGAVLAALVLLAVRAHRNTQLRYRRPGERIEAPPVELRAVEKTAFVSGAEVATPIATLDRALSQLAGHCHDNNRSVPTLVTATLSENRAHLTLEKDAELPAPWTGDGRHWSLDLAEPVERRDDVLPPYPLLVTVGQDDSGDLWMVNLEHLAVINLTGDNTQTTALARHIAAELALNPWSVLVKVTLIGIGEELVDLDELRLTHHHNGGPVIDTIVRDLTIASQHGWDDPDPYRVVITAGEGADALAPLLATPTNRLGAAVVSLSTPAPGATAFHIDGTGRLRVPTLDLDLDAAGLSLEEAAACAAIVNLTRESQTEKIAPFKQAADDWRALSDEAGALREELTEARDSSPAGEDSLLPDAAASYEAAAATTAEDIEILAPVVPQQVRRTVEEADPSLDEDLADWFASASNRPRLHLLGAVSAEAFGEKRPVVIKRRQYFVEVLAYLALHPQGATAHQLAESFGISPSRARTDVSSLRDWLGMNPETKAPYLPAANESPVYFASGVQTYQVQGVLVDLDLFRRLRLRGQARGADGLEDLKAAMSLVDQMPFSLLREKGWSWLFDAERVHETIGCAIVDTAHVLVVDALAKGDLALAREVAETACVAAPNDDICRLDLVKVTAAEGHGDAAEKMLTDVINRTDDYLPPIDPSARTREILDKKGWGESLPRRPDQARGQP